MNKVSLRRVFGQVFLVVFSFALFSCSNMSGGGSSSSKNSYPVVRFVANMQSDLATAPQEISGLVSASAGDAAFCDDGLSRSAMPEIAIDAVTTPGGTHYYVEAVTGKEGTDSYIRHFVYGSSSTLELGLESGKTWSVTCGIGVIEVAYDPNGNESASVQTVYMSDNDPSVTISPDNPVYAKTFGLKPSTEGSGRVELTFYVDSSSGIDIDASILSVECADSRFKVSDFSKSFDTEKIVFVQDPGKTVPSGSYELVIKFKKESGMVVYVTNQTVNVFDNMTTNSWRDDGSGAFESKTVGGKEITAFVLDDALITQFIDNTIYVGANVFSSTASDDNAGTAFTPLAKLDAAFKRIAANGNGKDYRIYICGTLDEPNMTVSGGINDKAASITIEGYNGLGTTDGMPQDKILGKAFEVGDNATLNIASSVPITTKNIWLAKKDGESGQSRGLYLQSGANVTLGPGTVISGFDAGSNNGGGVAAFGSTTSLTIKGAVIKGNTADNGGGVALIDGASLTMTSGEISQNQSYSNGGGLFSARDSGTGYSKILLSGTAKLCKNKSDESGGGAWLEHAKLTVKGSAAVEENVAGNGSKWAGGICIKESGSSLDISGNPTFAKNKGSKGGAINAIGCGVTISGGTFSGNIATQGAGVRAFVSSLALSGGTFENNDATLGGAIYVFPGEATSPTSFDLSGTAYIPYGVNGTKGAGKNDVYFAGPNGTAYASIALQSALSKHGKPNPVAIRIADAGAKRGVPVVKAVSPLASLDACKDSFKLYSDDWNLKLSSDKKTLVLDAPIWVAGTDKQQCTGTPSADGPGTKSAPYDTIEHACDAMTDSSVEYTILIDGTLTAKQSFKSCDAASISIEGANGLYPAGHAKAGQPMDAIDGSGIIASNQKDYMLYIGVPFDITIKNLKIKGGDRSWRSNEGNVEGGGIFLSSGKTLTLSSGTLITENKARQGGGVYVRDSTLVIEDGAKITKNTATGGSTFEGRGGGVYLHKNNSKPVLKMAGGEISGNIASNGGGVGLYGASFFMYGNAIIGADLPEGQVGSSDTDKGCNTANFGGGIYLVGSNVYLGYEDANEDGSPKTPHKLEKGVIGNYSYGISSNTLTPYGGGGIYWRYHSNGEARIYIASGQIAKNAAEQKGGAIYYDSDSNTTSTLTIGGDASIPALAGAGMNDVYLLSPATLAGALTKHGASNPITITPEGGKMTHGATVFKTDPERVLTSDDLKCFKLSAEQEAAGLDLTLSSDCKSIKLDKPIYVRKGGTPSGSGTANGTKTKPYGSIQAACGAMNNTSLDYTILVDGIDPSTGDPIPLLGAQTISDSAKAASITIRGANGLYPADHEKAGQPKDCIQGGSIYSSAADVKNLKIQNLKITGNNKISTSGGSGGGVCSSVNTTLTLCSGTYITENTANRGGGVYKKGGTLVIESGVVIKGNTVVTDSYVTGYGSIEDRGIGCGGGIFLDEGTSLVMSGGTISSNSAEKKGGGIYVQNASNANPKVSLFIYGDAVIGGVPSPAAYPTNKANALDAGGNSAPYGGGIYIKDAILSRVALYLGYSAAESDGTPKTPTASDAFTGCISGNYASTEGGGIHLYYATLYYNSGEISFNNSSYGGGIRPYCGHVKMSGGTIANNYASGWGGAVYNYGDFTLTSKPCTAYIPYGINGSEGAGKNDVYLYSSDYTIKIDDGALLTMASPIATVHFGTYSRGLPVLSGSDLDWWCDYFALTSSDWLIGGEGKLVSALPLRVTYDLNITDTKAAPAASAFSLVDALSENPAENPAVIDEVDLFVTNVLKPSYDGFVGTDDKIFKFAGWDANNDGTADITIDPDATSFYYPDNFLDYVAATAHAITLKAVWTEDTSPSDDTLEAVYSNITYDTSYYNDHDEFRIYTAEQARQVFGDLRSKNFGQSSGGSLVSGTQKTITLCADLDLGNMAPATETFFGLLDGNGHTLTVNLGGNKTNGKYGFFYNVSSGGVVRDLTIAGTINAPSGTNEVGAICGLNSGTIDSCTVTATVTASGTGGNSAGVGGLVGRACGAVTNCTFSGTVEGSGQRGVGGIVGYVQYGTISLNTVTASATIKYTGTDTSAGIGAVVGKDQLPYANDNTVELGATVDGGDVLTANHTGY